MVRLVVIALALGLSACQGFLMSSTGDMMGAYTTKHLVPYNLASPDPAMTCQIAEATGNLLLSYHRVTDAPHKGYVSTLASAGICEEARIYEAELRGLRALKRGDSAEAQDARFAEQRHHAVAARRFYRAWQHMHMLFKEKGADGCPAFEEDEEHSDEVAWLVGHVAAVQAVQHDRAAKGEVGVPTDLPQQVARSVRCLDNEKWWGAPAALQAAIWTSVPGSGPAGVDPWAQLTQATEIAKKSGIRVAFAIAAQAAEGSGREDEMRKQIKAFLAAGAVAPPKKWQMFDLQAQANVRHQSDRAWTKALGHRTPTGELGSFPGEAAAEPEGPSIFDE